MQKTSLPLQDRKTLKLRVDKNNKGEVMAKEMNCSGPNYQAYQILHFAFAVAPIDAGFDKFFNFLTNWEKYLSHQFDILVSPHTTMMVVGVVEIIAGIGVWVKPKFFSYIVALWLLGII